MKLSIFGKSKQPQTIRDVAVKTLEARINEYADWYAEQGLVLPPDYAADPTGWTEALRKMQRAFSLLEAELNEDGELWDAKNEWKDFGEQDAEKIKYLEAEITEGLALFGKYLYYLTDTIVDRGPAH